MKIEDKYLYSEEQILNAIIKEGLAYDCYGYKTRDCIWIYQAGQENDEIWDKFPTPYTGYERAHWDGNVLEPVNYYMLKSRFA